MSAIVFPGRTLLLPLLLLLLFALALPARAALPVNPPAPATAASASGPTDPLGRETPRSTVSGLIKALAEHDYDLAGKFFDMPDATESQRVNAAARAREFHALLDNGGSLNAYALLSNTSLGKVDDDLPLDEEEVGKIIVHNSEVPILLIHSEESGQKVWRISNETAGQVALAMKRSPAPAKNREEGFIVAGAPLQDWALLVGLGFLIFGGLWSVSAFITIAIRRLFVDPRTNSFYHFIEAALSPLSLLIAVVVFSGRAEGLPIAIVARQTLLRYTGIVAVIAFVWFGLRIVDAISELAIVRMQRHSRRQVVSVITLLRRTAKVVLLLLSGIGILDTFGINVTTGIAALGIGGIALALGTQKTVENLVGSVTVIADTPAQIGDFIHVGDIVGTVDDIGIRSTRIRTVERTVVTIPNGDLSARQIENFAARDRFLFNPVIAVDCGMSSAKLREAIRIVQQVLAGHDKIAKGARANLARIGEHSFNIEVFSYIDVPEFDASVIVCEELLLSIYERLEAAGIGLAFRAPVTFFASSQRQEARTYWNHDADPGDRAAGPETSAPVEKRIIV